MDVLFQSTHPVRGATAQYCTVTVQMAISIHAPREGCDSSYAFPLVDFSLFQSTHPVRGATRQHIIFRHKIIISIHAPREGCDSSTFARAARRAISIHAPREGCDFLSSSARMRHPISIHAPREGCDAIMATPGFTDSIFQSTHPVRGATGGGWLKVPHDQISIHAPREGCDHRAANILRRPIDISIHAPREGCDMAYTAHRRRTLYFNPRTP